MRPHIPSPVQAGDFHWFPVGDPSAVQLSASAREWLIVDQANSNLDKFIASAGLEFATKLLSRFRLAGVLHCELTTRNESDQEWLVFAKAATTASHAIVLDDVVGSRCKGFVFLPLARLSELKELEPMLANGSLTAFQRFFVHFGGLRISAPHLGGTYFLQHPTPCPAEMLAAKRAAPSWRGSSMFYVINHRDYLLLNQQGEVGYIPIDPDQPIRYDADSFESFLEQWLREL